jgi:hypothetical protein
MKTKRGIFWKALVFIILIFLIEFIAIFYTQRNNIVISWELASILNYFSFLYNNLSILFKVLFLIQGVLSIMILLFFAIMSFRKEYKTTTIQSDTRGTKTDIDTLYESLQEERQIKLSDVAKKFRIDKEVALDWFRILEDAKLAEVIYPSFGEPRIKSFVKKQDKNFQIEEAEEILENEKTEKIQKSSKKKKHKKNKKH